MSDFWLYFKLGLEHVLDWNAYDHVLFIMVLTVAYSFDSWKRLLLLVTMFTVGHSISLLMSNFDIVNVSSAWIEFLIPVTILIGALFNVITTNRNRNSSNVGVLYIVTVFFGLIHGFGFASFFKAVNDENEILPLLEFALGIEIAQIIVVIIVLVAGYLLKSLLKLNQRDWVLVLSSIVIGLVIPMLTENWIF